MSHTDQEPPIEYRDISATESLVYCLNYTIPSVIAEFTGIPDDTLYSTAQPGLLPAVWLMAHLAMYEHQLIQKAFQLNDNVPEALLLCTNAGDDEFQRLQELQPSKDELVESWQSVRNRTTKCLMSLRVEQLKEVYPGQCQVCAEHAAAGKDGHPEPHDCHADSFRELVVELITHQNYCLGQLHVIRCLASGQREIWAKW